MCISERPDICLSTEIWADDFDDGNYNGWTIFGTNQSTVPPSELPGNFSVEDGSLRATGPGWNHAYHPSAIAYGTWSFDVHVVDTALDHFFVGFMSTSNFSDPYGVYDYALVFNEVAFGSFANPYIALGWHRRTPGADGVDWDIFASIQFPDGIMGWHHIDITRGLDDFFYVYLNGSYAFGLNHDTYSESMNFHFYAPAGPAIDNIVVDDSVLIDLVPPVFSRAFEDQTVAAGADFRYDVNATDSSGIDPTSWAVNDTATFDIDSNGVITNLVALGVGTYNIEVSVDDTWGNTASDVLKVIVESPPIDWLWLMIAALGIGILIVGCLAYYWKKRG